jgi:hypothetical protein
MKFDSRVPAKSFFFVVDRRGFDHRFDDGLFPANVSRHTIVSYREPVGDPDSLAGFE